MTKNNLVKLVLGAALTVGAATSLSASDAKCGAGKCGGKKEANAGKCGGKKDGTGKGAGKCGSKKQDGTGSKCGGKK